jgi:hypothetical protein
VPGATASAGVVSGFGAASGTAEGGTAGATPGTAAGGTAGFGAAAGGGGSWAAAAAAQDSQIATTTGEITFFMGHSSVACGVGRIQTMAPTPPEYVRYLYKSR